MDDFPSIDHELILDLASGRISGDEADRLEAGLSQEQADELAAQRAVISAIAGLEPPVLSPAERTELHRKVAEEARLMTRELDARAIAAQPVRPGRRKRRWIPAAGLAGAMVVVAGLAVAAPVVLGGAGDDDADPIAETTTTVRQPGDTLPDIGDHPDVHDGAVAEFVADPGTPAEVLQRELSRTPPALDPRDQPCSTQAMDLVGSEPDGVNYGFFNGQVSIAYRFVGEDDSPTFHYFVVDGCEPIVEDSAGNLQANAGSGGN